MPGCAASHAKIGSHENTQPDFFIETCGLPVLASDLVKLARKKVCIEKNLPFKESSCITNLVTPTNQGVFDDYPL